MSGNSTEVRNNEEDGLINEVVGHGDFHLEQMDSTTWWLTLGDVTITISARAKVIAVLQQ